MIYIINNFFILFLGLGNQWLDKILQLYQITQLNHGLMIVGPSGSGKSTAWQVLLKALEHHEGIEGILDFFLLMFDIQCTLDLVTLFVSAETVTKPHNVAKSNDFM